MNAELDEYKRFVDGLAAACNRSSLFSWIEESGWPDTPRNTHINEFLNSLTTEQRKVVLEIAKVVRQGGIFDAILQLEGYRIQNIDTGVTVPDSPPGWSLHEVFVYRCAGDEWDDWDGDDNDDNDDGDSIPDYAKQ